MEKLTYKLPCIMMILVMTFTAFNVSLAQKAKSIEGNTTIELNGYSLVSSPGDDWKYSVTADKNKVQLIFESSNFLTGKENSAYVVVFKDSMISEINKSEREYADEFLEENLNGFKTYEKQMKITRYRKYDTSIAGRNYFAMSSSANDRDNAIPPTYADNLFFIYFPDDFKTSRIFYQFVISSYFNLPPGKKDSNESDLKPIFSIMKSFKMKEAVVPNKNE